MTEEKPTVADIAAKILKLKKPKPKMKKNRYGVEVEDCGCKEDKE